MRTYCFKCRICGYRTEGYGPAWHCESDMARDYAAENFGVGAGVRVSKTGTNRDQAKLFLPQAKDYAGPGDPDGSKGLRAWNESHGPKSGNTRPVRPEMPLHSKEVL